MARQTTVRSIGLSNSRPSFTLLCCPDAPQILFFLPRCCDLEKEWEIVFRRLERLQLRQVRRSEAEPSDREVLAGLAERVTYQNTENGYCVILRRTKVPAGPQAR
jgi:hypothetical protein